MSFERTCILPTSTFQAFNLMGRTNLKYQIGYKERGLASFIDYRDCVLKVSEVGCTQKNAIVSCHCLQRSRCHCRWWLVFNSGEAVEHSKIDHSSPCWMQLVTRCHLFILTALTFTRFAPFNGILPIFEERFKVQRYKRGWEQIGRLVPPCSLLNSTTQSASRMRSMWHFQHS